MEVYIDIYDDIEQERNGCRVGGSNERTRLHYFKVRLNCNYSRASLYLRDERYCLVSNSVRQSKSLDSTQKLEGLPLRNSLIPPCEEEKKGKDFKNQVNNRIKMTTICLMGWWVALTQETLPKYIK